jgi:flagellar basal body-associated protein FliL
MAEEEAAKEHEEPKKARSPATILLLVAVLIMILTPVITILSFRVLSKDLAKEAESPTLDPMEVALPRLQVNVAEANGTRYAQIDIVVEVSGQDVANLLSEDSDKSKPSRLNRVMSSVIGVTSDKPLNVLLSAEGKRELAQEIKEEINSLLADATSGMVTEVYFSGFLIQ